MGYLKLKGVLLLMLLIQARQDLSQFEAATVKTSNNSASGVIPRGCRGTDTRTDSNAAPIPLGRCIFEQARLDVLITSAYGDELAAVRSQPPKELVLGGPSWIHSDRFDVQAKAESPSTTSGKDLYRMLQALLADRFKLKLHHESKEVEGYALVIATSGPKLIGTKDSSSLPRIRRTPSAPGLTTIRAENTAMEAWARALSTMGIGIVVDMTKLQGRYDFSFSFGMDGLLAQGRKDGPQLPVSDGSAPSIFTALQEQLGLRLVAQKVSFDFLVVDSVEKPQMN
jgi:uncharacterized protein (TIGR03435 family)